MNIFARQTGITVHIRYFAVLREQAGRSEETLQTTAANPADLYRELTKKHGLQMDASLLRVSVNEQFADLHGALHDGDRVVFIPPVSGG